MSSIFFLSTIGYSTGAFLSSVLADLGFFLGTSSTFSVSSVYETTSGAFLLIFFTFSTVLPLFSFSEDFATIPESIPISEVEINDETLNLY